MSQPKHAARCSSRSQNLKVNERIVNDLVLYPDDSPIEQKKPRLGAPLHSEFVAPLSFLTDAVHDFDTFFERDGEADTLFGLVHEAFVRPVYVDISEIIIRSIDDKYKTENMANNKLLLLILCGSSGIGKLPYR
jgi:hypothetical protein